MGYRCTCHHQRRRCKAQCPATATAIRGSDGRPVCASCVGCDPAESAGFSFPSDAVTVMLTGGA